jgi:hypothetical protein
MTSRLPPLRRCQSSLSQPQHSLEAGGPVQPVYSLDSKSSTANLFMRCC